MNKNQECCKADENKVIERKETMSCCCEQC